MGQHLAARLVGLGAKVTILCRGRGRYPVPFWAGQVGWFELPDGKDEAPIIRAAVAQADVIFDFAGSSGAVASNREPLLSLEANCRSQLILLDACEHAARRPHIVFASSWLVYGATARERIAETHPVAPQSMYAVHKLSIEHYLRIYARRGKITFSICRISNPYGFDPNPFFQGFKILNLFVRLALTGEPICLFGDGRQIRDFIYVADVVEALVQCGCSPGARDELFNISLGESHSLLEAATMLQELAGPVVIQFRPWPDEYSVVESGDYVADISKARNKLGFLPAFDLRAGLTDTLRLYRQNKLASATRTGPPQEREKGSVT